tara:strand:+ start:845 stop:1075 length:231 start_codon:yes stop_codon:yes gene_type:complete
LGHVYNVLLKYIFIFAIEFNNIISLENILPDNELKCESIMDDSLDESYVGKWNRWNGHELPDQIVHGVNELYEQCY